MRRWLRDLGFPVLVLAAMALALALDGRGFAELGTKGLRATEIVRADEQEASLSRQVKVDRQLAERLERTNAAVQGAIQSLSRQEERLARIETER